MMVNAVDLFCGIGGLTREILNAGIKVLAGIDLDADCENTRAKLIELDNKRLYPWVEYVYLYENEQWKVTAIKEDRNINFVKYKRIIWQK